MGRCPSHVVSCGVVYGQVTYGHVLMAESMRDIFIVYRAAVLLCLYKISPLHTRGCVLSALSLSSSSFTEL